MKVINNEKIHLGKKSFSLNDQLLFSIFSGDKNPIHIDTINSRKSIAGECIVHGINAFLWTLELFIIKNSYIYEEYEIYFIRKIALNKEINCFWDKDNKEISIYDNENKLISIKYKNNKFFNKNIDGLRLDLLNKLDEPLNPNDDYLENNSRIKNEYGGEIKKAKNIYPNLSNKVGINRVYEVAILSNIIGMQIPGLNSLFYSCKISIIDKLNSSPEIFIKSFNKKLRTIYLDYFGKNITSELKAFSLTKSPSSLITKEIKNKLEKIKTYKGKRIIIIGGSRGIGSFLAKTIALLGGEVSITYYACKNEAIEVSNEINANIKNSSCKYFKFDVLNDDYCEKFKNHYDYLFYFATPKIISQDGQLFNDSLYRKFKLYYCDAFKKTALGFIKNKGEKIYYPSSIFVEQTTKGFEEYINAKKDGEHICRSINSDFSIKILIERLKRVDTDQNLSIKPQKSLDPYEVAIKIASKLIEF